MQTTDDILEKIAKDAAGQVRRALLTIPDKQDQAIVWQKLIVKATRALKEGITP